MSECDGRMDWPRRGVYFFHEPGEVRREIGTGLRIVRVGTHALITGGEATLWGRLRQHKGRNRSIGGNHRGSVFRKLLGTALIYRDGHNYPTWGRGSKASKDIRMAETPLEGIVSEVIGAMPFLWLEIDDEPGPTSMRGYIERNSIALLSNYGKEHIDPPSNRWLGFFSGSDRIKSSGLWNRDHVNIQYDPTFLDEMGRLVARIGGSR